MRVFKGGRYTMKSGKNYPSLSTCNFIKPNTNMYVDNLKNTWAGILNSKRMEGWKVDY
jgi:hypothetical protein